jgi:hypothetical protein
MDKWLCWGSLGIAALLLLLFLLDLFAGFPFNGANKVLDVCAIIAAGIIIYISWDTVREIK